VVTPGLAAGGRAAAAAVHAEHPYPPRGPACSGPAQSPKAAARGRPLEITEPGIYDIPDAEYHKDPVPGGSLSASGARRLLPPSCPALFRHYLDHPPEPSAVFDLGHAAHKLVLGAGPPIVALAYGDWRTKEARELRDRAHAEGETPLLRGEYEQVKAMAEAIRAHPLASVLFAPETGEPERSLFWQDPETGVWCRARPDWLPAWRGASQRLIITDFKTTACAERSSFARSVHKFGYFQQAPFYIDGVRALGLDDDPAFLFVAQEKAPPYLVTVFELDAGALAAGRAFNRRAIEVYRDCKEAGVWPGYSDDIELISLPPWAARIEEYA
jgi:PDDEXK-like domain of unknown function (DUF3799)